MTNFFVISFKNFTKCLFDYNVSLLFIPKINLLFFSLHLWKIVLFYYLSLFTGNLWKGKLWKPSKNKYFNFEINQFLKSHFGNSKCNMHNDSTSCWQLCSITLANLILINIGIKKLHFIFCKDIKTSTSWRIGGCSNNVFKYVTIQVTA